MDEMAYAVSGGLDMNTLHEENRSVFGGKEHATGVDVKTFVWGLFSMSSGISNFTTPCEFEE